MWQFQMVNAIFNPIKHGTDPSKSTKPERASVRATRIKGGLGHISARYRIRYLKKTKLADQISDVRAGFVRSGQRLLPLRESFVSSPHLCLTSGQTHDTADFCQTTSLGCLWVQDPRPVLRNLWRQTQGALCPVPLIGLSVIAPAFAGHCVLQIQKRIDGIYLYDKRFQPTDGHVVEVVISCAAGLATVLYSRARHQMHWFEILLKSIAQLG